jgi:signal transduction histidine kinase
MWKPNFSPKHAQAKPASEAPCVATPKPFPFLRFFIPTSFLIILIMIILIQYIYRRTAVNNVITLGETTNVSLANMALLSIQPQLREYLNQMAGASPETAVKQTLPAELKEAIQRLISETKIVGVKICNRHGLVIYSTLSSEVGQDQLDDSGVKGAMSGKIMSELVYRDSFSFYDSEPNESNLVQTYMPALKEPFGTVLGAVEFSFDVNSLVKQNEQSQLLMLLILGGVFLLIFALLVSTVWRAESVMTLQYKVLYERTKPLEFLTAQMLSDQELEKKTIAHSLHESVTQTLHAIKMQLESMVRHGDKSSPLVASLSGLIEFLQEAISEVRLIAMNLRPASLDELGLLKTIEWFVKKMQMAHPRLSFDSNISAKEGDIAPSLKIIIFRIVQDTLNNLAAQTEADRIQLVLRSGNGWIELEIEENSLPYASNSVSGGEHLNKSILSMRERTLLSGGNFFSQQARLGCTHRSRWNV